MIKLSNFDHCTMQVYLHYHRKEVNEIDYMEFHPRFTDFEKMIEDFHNCFPYNCMIFPGNHSELVDKVVSSRGYNKVTRLLYR